jgi:anti-sigma-K factor RskA
MTDEIDREEGKALAAEYALGLLTPDEARAFEERMAYDPDLRAAYALWAEHLARLTDDIAPVAPPPALQGRIQADVHPSPTATRRLRTIWGVVAATAVVLAALAFVWVRNGQGPQFAPAYVAVVAAKDRSLVIDASFDPATGALKIQRKAGAAASGRALELWLIAGKTAPKSLGVLPAAPDATLEVPPDLRAAVPGATLAVSDEPPGGSPTGQPTGAVLATGAVTDL